MKLNLGRRILMFFHWLISLLICVALTVYILKPQFVTGLVNGITTGWSPTQKMVVGIAMLVIYVALVVVQACIIFHRGKRVDRDFIVVDSSETGRVRIAVPAIEQMVRQSISNIDGLTGTKINIESQDDAINIGIVTTLQNGAHVPTVTMNMQQSIRKFVQTNCGVAVRSVSISINSVSNTPEIGRRRGRKSAAEPPTPVFEEPPKSIEPEPEATTEADDEDIQPVEAPVFRAVEPEAEPDAKPDAIEDDLPEVKPIRLHLDYVPQQEDSPSTDPDAE